MLLLMRLFFFLVMLFSAALNAQVVNKTDSNQIAVQDSVVIDSGSKDSLEIFRPTIHDYQYRKVFGEKKILDTALTYDKTYIYSQYNNQDNFERVQFANIGAGYNPLAFQFNPEQNLSLLPANKSYLIRGEHEINYYDVKTPTTMFIYHNAMRNGAALQTTYTQNIGKNFNFAVEYYGLRSQGYYRNSLAANNNTIFSGHFTSGNGKYEAFAHYIHQNINNQEFGGIVRDDLYQAGDDSFSNKANVQVNLAGSSSQFSYRRYYLSHQYTPFSSENFPFRIRHTIYHQGNKYHFNQTGIEEFYFTNDSDIFDGYPLSSQKYSENLSNKLTLMLDNQRFKLEAGLRHQRLELGISQGFTLDGLEFPHNMRENRLGAVANLQMNLWEKIDLDADFEFSNGKTFGTFLRSANQLRFEPLEDYFVNAKVNFQSATPTFNYHINPSMYRQYNFYRTDFRNENILEAGADVHLKWFRSSVFANYLRIDNFAFFDAAAQPSQSSSSVNVSQIGGEATFSFGKFHLNTRLQFQSTLSNKDLLPLPNFLGRLNLFYQSKAFNNNAEIQTGIKGHFYSKFASREFFPILNEYILPGPSSFSIGGNPVVDLYFNLKVKRMFFFIEGQNMLEIFKVPIYTAPHYPIYDFRLNVGIVWYLIS